MKAPLDAPMFLEDLFMPKAMLSTEVRMQLADMGYTRVLPESNMEEREHFIRWHVLYLDDEKKGVA
jgi:hypothetical protein